MPVLWYMLCSLNTRSVRNKTDDILDYVGDCNYKAETWLRGEDSDVRVDLCPDGYKFIDQCRTGRRGGGTGLMFRDSGFNNVKKEDGGQNDSYEFSEWLVSESSSSKLRVVIIYRPPYTEDHPMTVTTFCNEFARYMESPVLSKEQLVIVVDMNIHVDDANDLDACKFLDLLESFGLKQHVVEHILILTGISLT